jgi:TRAP transporter TAXI family solute receptor
MGIANQVLSAGQATKTATPPALRDQAPKFWRDAKLHLRFAGGRSNLTFIARYIAEGMQGRLSSDAVWSMYGGMRLATMVNAMTLGDGEVDFAVVTPPVAAKMALDGKGDFPKAYPKLRAIAVFPQDDWLGCAVRADLGVSSFEELKAKKIPLRLATDSRNTGVGFLTERVLEAYGISVKDLEAWGGRIVVTPGPVTRSVAKMLAGEADAVCHEAWKGFRPLTAKIPVKFLPVSEEVLTRLNREFGYGRRVIRKGLYQPNVPDRDIPVVDFSDWVVLAHADLSDDLAYLAAKVAVEDRGDFETLYMGQKPDDRAVDLPLKPEIMWKNVGVPLHPGAEKYYREAGLMR